MRNKRRMKIGDRVYVHGFVDEIRKDCVIIRNDGGYFGTVKSEIVEAQNTEDIVSVVRCKDCNWYEPRILKCNNSKSTEWHPDDFCSDAKRKEE